MGNYNDVLMEQLADRGDGSYHYVDDLDEARRVFVEGLTGTLETVARQTKVQVAFDPETVRRYRLLGYENRDVADRDFRDDRVDAGEVGAGHEVTALFEVVLEDDARGGDDLATVRLRYEDPETRRVAETASSLALRDEARRFDDARASFRLDAAAAGFAEILRHSYWARTISLDAVRRVGRAAARDLDDRRAADDLLEMVAQARRLWPAAAPLPDDDDEPR
jgi:Ca-activated chloride channel family protein